MRSIKTSKQSGKTYERETERPDQQKRHLGDPLSRSELQIYSIIHNFGPICTEQIARAMRLTGKNAFSSVWRHIYSIKAKLGDESILLRTGEYSSRRSEIEKMTGKSKERSG